MTESQPPDAAGKQQKYASSRNKSAQPRSRQGDWLTTRIGISVSVEEAKNLGTIFGAVIEGNVERAV